MGMRLPRIDWLDTAPAKLLERERPLLAARRQTESHGKLPWPAAEGTVRSPGASSTAPGDWFAGTILLPTRSAGR